MARPREAGAGRARATPAALHLNLFMTLQDGPGGTQGVGTEGSGGFPPLRRSPDRPHSAQNLEKCRTNVLT